MEVFIQILASGLTLGAMYAISTIGLSLVYGSMNMLNMAHGAILAIGGYAAYAASAQFGLPAPVAVAAALLAGGAIGLVVFFATTLPLLNSRNFETNIFIATIGVGAVLQDGVLKVFGPYPKPQPVALTGVIRFDKVAIPYQNLAILFVALVMMAFVAVFLQRTRAGRAIRATSQNREAAQLMGVHVQNVYAQVLALSGVLAAISGVMLSSLTSLSPTMGADPMLKAFIVCVVAGLGNTYGAVAAAIAIGLMEAAAEYILGVRFGFASLLLLVIFILIWRPSGVFGKMRIVRL
jgi:branched-chain amino acid transport system permease protein